MQRNLLVLIRSWHRGEAVVLYQGARHEAFVKTFKQDYARVNLRPDAASVLRQLDAWFEHYNCVHPYKALGYPRHASSG